MTESLFPGGKGLEVVHTVEIGEIKHFLLVTREAGVGGYFPNGPIFLEISSEEVVSMDNKLLSRSF